MRVWVCALAILMAAGAAHAGSPDIKYGPPAAWVTPPPEPTKTETPEGSPLRVIYNDRQTWLGPDGDETFNAYRIKVLKPEALAFGNITITWNPGSDELTIHGLKIRRGDRVIDILDTTKFQILQRENNLDYAVLDGDLTATLQAQGLQVGDELEVAMTIKRRDATLKDRSTGFAQLPLIGSPGAQRVRIFWPVAKTVRWQASPDLGALALAEHDGRRELSYELRDPSTVIVADGAPARVNVRRRLEYSAFGSWGEISALFSPLFDQASKLGPSSPIRQEAAKIASATNDPAQRAEAALRLVQDRIRYVYVGLNGGNYRPANADETWDRRFGDCKAKTVVLMALLRELGVPAEAVLVNSQGGDGTDQLLPTPGAFDHVLVRSKIGSKTYWLDGTRLGDRLTTIPPPVFRWALPLAAKAATLQAISPEAPTLPQVSVVLDVDASAGFDQPAKIKAEQVLRGDGVLQLRSQLSAMSPADAERAVQTYWRSQYDWIQPSTGAWRFDELQNAMIFTMTGEGRPQWEGDDKEGRRLDIYSAGFPPPGENHRPKDQDQAAPWVTEFPSFQRWTTIIRLPAETAKWKWGYFADPMDEKLGGVSYRREASLSQGIMRTTKTRRVYLPEISAVQAEAVNERLPKFNDKISRVYQTDASVKPVDRKAQIEKAEAEAGKDPVHLVGVGGYLLSVRDYAEAIRLFDKTLQIDPGQTKAILGKALALDVSQDLTVALQFLDASKSGSDLQVALFRAELLMRANRMQEALTLLKGLYPTHRNDVQVVGWLAQAEFNTGAVERALADIDVAVALAPEEDWPRRTRALIRYRAKRYDLALQDYDELLRREPEAAFNFNSRSAALRKLGRLDEALEDLDEAGRIDPFNTSILINKARVLRAAGRAKDAVEVFEPWIARDKTGMALNDRCWDRAIANAELAEAESDCERALKLAPEDAGLWDSYALVALRQGELDLALQRYDKALTFDAKGSSSLFGRGVAKIRSGDKASGLADIAAAKKISPNAGVELTEAGVSP